MEFNKYEVLDLLEAPKNTARDVCHEKEGYFRLAHETLKRKLDQPNQTFCNFLLALLGDKDHVRCYNCGKFGHISVHCLKRRPESADVRLRLLPKVRAIINELLLDFGSTHNCCIWSCYCVKPLRNDHPVKSYTDMFNKYIVLMWQYTVILSPQSFSFLVLLLLLILSCFVFFLSPSRVVAVAKKSIAGPWLSPLCWPQFPTLLFLCFYT